MTVMDHERRQMGQEAAAPVRRSRHCPECLAPLSDAQPRQMFCTPAHQQAFNDRQRVRGRQLAPLAMAARITRGGSRRDKPTGIKARQASQRLIERWVVEDREAGRMAMDDYIAQRLRMGFETD